ncbi:YjaA family stress response protein [Morganella morganii]|uniref:YjaA family stress response protein n=1 Tax=Morganella morganii TaxID=582 RepID=UPI003D7FBD6B
MNIFYLYILLYQDKIVVRDVRTHREMTGIPETPFTTNRLLVGDMLSAAKTLQKTVSRLTSPLPLWKKIFSSRYAVLVHPMEMREGGLCNVEKRIFRELAGFIAPQRTGAVKAYVCDHPDMQPDQLVFDVMSGKFKLTDEEKNAS